MPDQNSKVILVLILVPRKALPPEQLQHILGPHSEEPFDDPARMSSQSRTRRCRGSPRAKYVVAGSMFVINIQMGRFSSL